jgi:hypothetical protein
LASLIISEKKEVPVCQTAADSLQARFPLCLLSLVVENNWELGWKGIFSAAVGHIIVD